MEWAQGIFALTGQPLARPRQQTSQSRLNLRALRRLENSGRKEWVSPRQDAAPSPEEELLEPTVEELDWRREPENPVVEVTERNMTARTRWQVAFAKVRETLGGRKRRHQVALGQKVKEYLMYHNLRGGCGRMARGVDGFERRLFSDKAEINYLTLAQLIPDAGARSFEELREVLEPLVSSEPARKYDMNELERMMRMKEQEDHWLESQQQHTEELLQTKQLLMDRSAGSLVDMVKQVRHVLSALAAEIEGGVRRHIDLHWEYDSVENELAELSKKQTRSLMQMNDFELRKQEATERYGRELESLQQEYAAARRAVRATKLQLVSDKSYCERISKQIQDVMAESMEKNAKVMAIEHLKRIERRRNILEREKAMRTATFAKENRELRAKLAARQAVLEEHRAFLTVSQSRSEAVQAKLLLLELRARTKELENTQRKTIRHMWSQRELMYMPQEAGLLRISRELQIQRQWLIDRGQDLELNAKSLQLKGKPLVATPAVLVSQICGLMDDMRNQSRGLLTRVFQKELQGHQVEFKARLFDSDQLQLALDGALSSLQETREKQLSLVKTWEALVDSEASGSMGEKLEELAEGLDFAESSTRWFREPERSTVQHLGTSREELDWLQHLEELLGRRCGELRAAAEALSKAPETASLAVQGLLGSMPTLLDEETVEKGQRFQGRMAQVMQGKKQFYGEMEETLSRHVMEEEATLEMAVQGLSSLVHLLEDPQLKQTPQEDVTPGELLNMLHSTAAKVFKQRKSQVFDWAMLGLGDMDLMVSDALQKAEQVQRERRISELHLENLLGEETLQLEHIRDAGIRGDVEQAGGNGEPHASREGTKEEAATDRNGRIVGVPGVEASLQHADIQQGLVSLLPEGAHLQGDAVHVLDPLAAAKMTEHDARSALAVEAHFEEGSRSLVPQQPPSGEGEQAEIPLPRSGEGEQAEMLLQQSEKPPQVGQLADQMELHAEVEIEEPGSQHARGDAPRQMRSASPGSPQATSLAGVTDLRPSSEGDVHGQPSDKVISQDLSSILAAKFQRLVTAPEHTEVESKHVEAMSHVRVEAMSHARVEALSHGQAAVMRPKGKARRRRPRAMTRLGADADDDDEGPDEVGQGVRLSVAFGSSAAALLRKVRGDPDVDVVPEQVMALQEKLREELESELEELTRQMDQEALAKPELEARRTTLLQHLQVVQLSIEKPSKQSEQRFVKTLLEIQETELNESSEQLASSWSLDLAPKPPKWSSAWKPSEKLHTEQVGRLQSSEPGELPLQEAITEPVQIGRNQKAAEPKKAVHRQLVQVEPALPAEKPPATVTPAQPDAKRAPLAPATGPRAPWQGDRRTDSSDPPARAASHPVASSASSGIQGPELREPVEATVRLDTEAGAPRRASRFLAQQEQAVVSFVSLEAEGGSKGSSKAMKGTAKAKPKQAKVAQRRRDQPTRQWLDWMTAPSQPEEESERPKEEVLEPPDAGSQLDPVAENSAETEVGDSSEPTVDRTEATAPGEREVAELWKSRGRPQRSQLLRSRSFAGSMLELPDPEVSSEVEAEGEEKRLAVKRWKLGGLAVQAMVRLRELVEPRRVSLVEKPSIEPSSLGARGDVLPELPPVTTEAAMLQTTLPQPKSAGTAGPAETPGQSLTVPQLPPARVAGPAEAAMLQTTLPQPKSAGTAGPAETARPHLTTPRLPVARPTLPAEIPALPQLPPARPARPAEAPAQQPTQPKSARLTGPPDSDSTKSASVPLTAATIQAMRSLDVPGKLGKSEQRQLSARTQSTRLSRDESLQALSSVGFSPYTSRTELHQSSTTNLSNVSPYASQTELQASTPKLSLPEPEDYQAALTPRRAYGVEAALLSPSGKVLGSPGCWSDGLSREVGEIYVTKPGPILALTPRAKGKSKLVLSNLAKPKRRFLHEASEARKQPLYSKGRGFPKPGRSA